MRVGQTRLPFQAAGRDGREPVAASVWHEYTTSGTSGKTQVEKKQKKNHEHNRSIDKTERYIEHLFVCTITKIERRKRPVWRFDLDTWWEFALATSYHQPSGPKTTVKKNMGTMMWIVSWRQHLKKKRSKKNRSRDAPIEFVLVDSLYQSPSENFVEKSFALQTYTKQSTLSWALKSSLLWLCVW